MSKTRVASLLAGSIIIVAACGGSSSSAGPTAQCPENAAKPSATTSPPPSSDLLKAGTLTVGSDVSYPPDEFYPDGCNGKDADGLDIDLGKALAARMGLQFALVDQKFEGIIPSLNTKKYDLIMSSMTITAERKTAVQFIPSFNVGESYVVDAKSTKSPQELKDLCGLKVAVEKGTTEESEAGDANDPAKNGPCAGKPIDFKNSDYDKDTQALTALHKGTVDVHYTDSPVAQYELLKNTGFKIANKKPQNVAPEGFAMRKDDSAMFNAIQAAFEAMKSDSTYKKLLDKWHLSDEDITKPAA
jgi:polar amino acid transport system substrate-binding protein